MGTNGDGAHPPEPDEDPFAGGIERWVPGPGWRRREGAPASFRAFADARSAEARRRRRRLRLVFGTTGVVLLVLAWSMAFSSGVSTVEQTVGDEAFLAAARDVCDPVRDRLADAAEARRSRDLDDGERAEALDGVVGELDDMVDELAELEPDLEDRAEVEDWLAQWGGVLASGRRTADALADGDRDAAALAARAGQDPARAVNAFAGANGIPACGTAAG